MLIGALITRITKEIINPLIVLVFLSGIAAFGWGIVLYLGAQGSDEKTQKAKKIMWWGIVGLFVLVSMWGAVYLLCDFFGTCSRAGFRFPGMRNFYFGDTGGNGGNGGGEGGGDGGDGGDGSGGGIDCSKDITEMTDTECNFCYHGGLSCATTLTPAEQAICLNGQSRCEPCLHYLDEGNPRAYVKCVKNILGF